ncbi:MAG TPA: thermonuclease family protein [Actinomycetes bacterium]|nr:thermonuclease family protein [Actinomycetes bacterium]
MPARLWVYRARPVRAVDGDTVDVVIDQGMHTQRLERLRLFGINCPEVHGETRPAGLAASAYTTGWLAEAGTDAWPLVLQTARSDVFGRWLAIVWRASDQRSLNDDLVAAGHAVAFLP